MNQARVETWRCTQIETTNQLLAALKSDFIVEIEPPIKSHITLLDDSDAHLWQAGCLLCLNTSQRLKLIDQKGIEGEIPFPQGAKFWWELPEGDMQRILKKLIGFRALIPIANIVMIEQQIALRNDDQKLVVRSQLRIITIDGNTDYYFSLYPLRGYSKHLTQAENVAKSFGCEKLKSQSLKQLLVDKVNPTSIREKSPLPNVNGKMPTEQVVRSLAVAMLQQASGQVPGVIADVDTEFLHHFRVCFRKVRSLVGLLHKSLPEEAVAILKPELSEIAGKTNKLRDLDVFLLEKGNYQEMLPSSFSKGLNELYEKIEREREREWVNIKNYFLSDDYEVRLAVCISGLSSSSALKTSISEKPLLPVVEKLALKRYQKILDKAALIDDKTVDAEIHELRKEFKRLRYLIDFFSDLFPQEEVRKIIGAIKKVQGVLGNFNDYSVQIDFLSHYLDSQRIEMSNAISGLIAVLHQKKIIERSKVDAAMENIRSPVMVNEIKHLFGCGS